MSYIVIGGGIIGMLTARELASAGCSVTLIDKNACAREATWAGGGIVSPLYPWRYPSAVTQLATWSQSSYIHLAAELKEETGIDPELRQKGMLMVDVQDETEALRWAAEFHRPLRQVDADFLYRTEPHLAPGIEQALWMPEVCSIRNPRLGQSLRQSLVLNERVRLLEHQSVAGFLSENGSITGVRTADGVYEADTYVVAAGAWSGELLGGLDISLPVEPVHGQMMLFKAEPGVIDRVVLRGDRYVIPRNDGRVLVGSTLERIGFVKRTTEEAAKALYASALEIVPALANYPVEHHWSGLRPGSPDGIPFIGNVPGYQNLFVNAGQFRNGLVLAPASTRLLADLVLQRQPIVDPTPYQLKNV
ncbi:glycine oxidase ThiO [Neptuniibacter sp. CAU 1671]|uniref:glycine oxidase ThiO n=1 Tax=Neptuniibacter sp. CAU 1671 TaxID=3032593 RepID=UPI0023D9C861|nr:glycine oxidase ThiO [Neptuniibacter sp. CAU 1671]MDF2182326.1 glycine oxidase ThiO [Neptuniibacter sp. CAU 1671]